MLETIKTFFFSIVSVVSAAFVAPEPVIPMVEEIVVEESPVIETVVEDPAPTPELPPAEPVDPFCEQNASLYTEEKYQEAKDQPEEDEERCEKKEKDKKSIDELTEDGCKFIRKRAEKVYSEWKKGYDEYKAKCS